MSIAKTLAALACAVVLGAIPAQAQSSFGIGLGLSTPNEAISSVYNNFPTGEEDLREAAALGYHFQLKYRFGLGESVRFAASLGLHRFPEADIYVVDPRDQKSYHFLATSNIVPITAGLEYSLVKSVIGVYLTGDLSYNYFTNSLDLVAGSDAPSVPLGLNDDASYSRVGAAIGAGVDFDLSVITLDLTGKYHLANLINKENSDEPDRNYFALTLSACFGSR